MHQCCKNGMCIFVFRYKFSGDILHTPTYKIWDSYYIFTAKQIINLWDHMLYLHKPHDSTVTINSNCWSSLLIIYTVYTSSVYSWLRMVNWRAPCCPYCWYHWSQSVCCLTTQPRGGSQGQGCWVGDDQARQREHPHPLPLLWRPPGWTWGQDHPVVVMTQTVEMTMTHWIVAIEYCCIYNYTVKSG